jgi:hypothetical protein
VTSAHRVAGRPFTSAWCPVRSVAALVRRLIGSDLSGGLISPSWASSSRRYSSWTLDRRGSRSSRSNSPSIHAASSHAVMGSRSAGRGPPRRGPRVPIPSLPGWNVSAGELIAAHLRHTTAKTHAQPLRNLTVWGWRIMVESGRLH